MGGEGLTHEQWILLIVLVGYVLLVMTIGIVAAMTTRTIAGYFLADRKLGPWTSALSSVASSESGWITLGAVGMGYEMGASAIWFVPGCLLGYAVNWYLIAERLREQTRRYGSLTIPDYLEARFADTWHVVRGIATVIIFLCMMGYVAAQFTAGGKVLNAVFAVPYTKGVLIAASVTVVYTLLGGFRAVSWTDVAQAALMFVGLVCMPILLIGRIGGTGEMFRQLSQESEQKICTIEAAVGSQTATFVCGSKPILLGPNEADDIKIETPDGRTYRVQRKGQRLKVFPTDEPASLRWLQADEPVELGGITFHVVNTKALAGGRDLADVTGGKRGIALIGLIVGLLGIGLGYPGQPQVVTRYMAAEGREVIHVGKVIAIVWGVCAFYGAVMLGHAARVLMPHLTDPEYAFPQAAVQFLPPAVAGLMLAGVIAAIMSTADSQLLVASSSVARDLFDKTIFRGRLGERWLVAISRVTVLVLGVGSVAMALADIRVVFWFVLYAWAGLGASFGPVILLALFWRGATKYGAIAGMVVGFGATVAWKNTAWIAGRFGVEASNLSDHIYELPPAFALAAVAMVAVSLLTSSAAVDPDAIGDGAAGAAE